MWIASGYCDMCKGMQGLALLVQEGLGRDPFLCVDRDYVAEPSRAPAEACQNLEFSATYYFLPLGRVRDPPAPLFRRDNMLEFYFLYRGVLKRLRSGALGGEMDRLAEHFFTLG